MALKSKLFRDDTKLQACLVQDSAHVTRNATGEHVAKLQAALAMLDGARIDSAEIAAKRYGNTTAAAVLAYKQARRIINSSYQTQADDIVGKMTIVSLDQEMQALEQSRREVASIRCDLGQGQGNANS
jgi:peptidoglycan hydrolase-like protein with peptidoglycan-binding domain